MKPSRLLCRLLGCQHDCQQGNCSRCGASLYDADYRHLPSGVWRRICDAWGWCVDFTCGGRCIRCGARFDRGYSLLYCSKNCFDRDGEVPF
jgi:hypothetical protein